MNRLIFPAMLASMILPAMADTYRFELNAFYENVGSEFDTGFSTVDQDSDAFAIGGSVYLKPVDDSVGPIAEAAFLNKASRVTIAYSTTKSSTVT